MAEKQPTPRKFTKRPLTRLERDKLRNQALVREEAKRMARATSTMTGLLAGQAGQSLPVKGDKTRVENKIAPKKDFRGVRPVIYQPDLRPNFAGTVAEPTFIVSVDPGPPRPDSNLRALFDDIRSFFGGDSGGMRFSGKG